MTNTEAITKLTNIMHDDHYSWHSSVLTAFSMAVDALRGAEGDYISRQAAIETARDVCKRNPTMAIRVMDALQKLPSEQPEQRWIPVTEELPKEKDAGILKKLGTSRRSEYVLATVDVKGERMTVTACTYDGEWDWNMKYAFPDYKIVAWMPLPEPYRKEGECE